MDIKGTIKPKIIIRRKNGEVVMPRGRPKKQLELTGVADKSPKELNKELGEAFDRAKKKKSSLEKEMDDLWQKLNKLNDMRFVPLMDQLNQAKELLK